MAQNRILLRSGYVIDTEIDPVARTSTHVLIEGDRIGAVGEHLLAEGAEVLDATDRLVLPGIVDTQSSFVAVQMATLDGVRALGMADRIGSLTRVK